MRPTASAERHHGCWGSAAASPVGGPASAALPCLPPLALPLSVGLLLRSIQQQQPGNARIARTYYRTQASPIFVRAQFFSAVLPVLNMDTYIMSKSTTAAAACVASIARVSARRPLATYRVPAAAALGRQHGPAAKLGALAREQCS